MADTFKTMLAVGGKVNTLGRAAEVVDIVLADRSRIDELYQCLFEDDAWLRMRAIDSIEKICREHPDWLLPYLPMFLNEITAIDQPSIQWHLAQMYSEIELAESKRAKAIDIMKRHLSTTAVDWIVASNCMKTLVEFAHRGYLPASEIIPLLEIQKRHHSKAVVKRATKLLDELTNN